MSTFERLKDYNPAPSLEHQPSSRPDLSLNLDLLPSANTSAYSLSALSTLSSSYSQSMSANDSSPRSSGFSIPHPIHSYSAVDRNMNMTNLPQFPEPNSTRLISNAATLVLGMAGEYAGSGSYGNMLGNSGLIGPSRSFTQESQEHLSIKLTIPSSNSFPSVPSSSSTPSNPSPMFHFSHPHLASHDNTWLPQSSTTSPRLQRSEDYQVHGDTTEMNVSASPSPNTVPASSGVPLVSLPLPRIRRARGSGTVRRAPRPKTLQCPECDRCFDRPSLLDQHSVTHTGAKPHICPYCNGKRYTRRSNLYRHIRVCKGAVALGVDHPSSTIPLDSLSNSPTTSDYAKRRTSKPKSRTSGRGGAEQAEDDESDLDANDEELDDAELDTEDGAEPEALAGPELYVENVVEEDRDGDADIDEVDRTSEGATSLNASNPVSSDRDASGSKFRQLFDRSYGQGSGSGSGGGIRTDVSSMGIGMRDVDPGGDVGSGLAKFIASREPNSAIGIVTNGPQRTDDFLTVREFLGYSTPIGMSMSIHEAGVGGGSEIDMLAGVVMNGGGLGVGDGILPDTNAPSLSGQKHRGSDMEGWAPSAKRRHTEPVHSDGLGNANAAASEAGYFGQRSSTLVHPHHLVPSSFYQQGPTSQSTISQQSSSSSLGLAAAFASQASSSAITTSPKLARGAYMIKMPIARKQFVSSDDVRTSHLKKRVLGDRGGEGDADSEASGRSTSLDPNTNLAAKTKGGGYDRVNSTSSSYVEAEQSSLMLKPSDSHTSISGTSSASSASSSSLAMALYMGASRPATTASTVSGRKDSEEPNSDSVTASSDTLPPSSFTMLESSFSGFMEMEPYE